jgi:predicted ABC-type ATPase
MPNLYIIAGCNGAGKTTASYKILPKIFDCKEFVNADSIAAGLSPLNAENVAIEAGRIMLHRINQLMEEKVDFAFETTLSTRSYVSLVKKAQESGYQITLLYFWLPSPQMAIERVAKRVSQGGHNIPEEVVIRRYYRGLQNLMNLYINICNVWMVINNVNAFPDMVAEGGLEVDTIIENTDIWDVILIQSREYGK